MALMRTGNPTLSANAFSGTRAAAGEESMTLQGAVNKTAILLLLLTAASCWTWGQMRANPAYVGQWSLIWLLVGFVVALVTVFKKSWAPVTAPIYAVVEGLLLGGISSLFELRYPGDRDPGGGVDLRDAGGAAGRLLLPSGPSDAELPAGGVCGDRRNLHPVPRGYGDGFLRPPDSDDP